MKHSTIQRKMQCYLQISPFVRLCTFFSDYASAESTSETHFKTSWSPPLNICWISTVIKSLQGEFLNFCLWNKITGSQIQKAWGPQPHSQNIIAQRGCCAIFLDVWAIDAYVEALHEETLLMNILSQQAGSQMHMPTLITSLSSSSIFNGRKTSEIRYGYDL
jgi:hypothetical protein